MLAAIRAFAKSWVATLLIGLLIVSFAVFGIRDVFGRSVHGDWVIRAGSRTIGSAEYKRESDEFRQRAEQQVGQPVTPEVAAANGLDKQVLKGMALNAAFNEMLQRAGIRPSDKLLADELHKIPAFFDPVTGRFDKTAYQEKLGQNQLTPAMFERTVRDQIAQQHLGAALSTGFALPRAYGALAALYSLESRDIGYFSIDPASVPAPPTPTDAQLNQFIKENASQLTRPETRILTIVRFSPTLVSQNLTVDEAELKKRYDFKKDTLSTPETRTLVQIPAKDAAVAAQISQRLAKGEDPAAVAKSLGVDAITYADKPQSAIADKRVGAAAFRLPAGQVSGPIQGDLGLAVVKVVKVNPGHAVTLEEARPQLEAELRKDAAAEKVYNLTQAYDDAHAAGANLTEAAKKAGVPIMTLPAVSAEGRTPEGQPTGLPPKLLQTAFGLPAGGESEVEELGNGEYFAVRVEKINPAAVPPLAEIKPQLTRFWMLRETAKALQARADVFAKRLEKGESLEAVATAAGAKPARVVGLDRPAAQENKTLSRDALGKAMTAKLGEVFTAEDTKFGLIVAKVEAVHPGGGPNLARMTEELRSGMAPAVFRDLGEAARQASYDKLKVKLNPNLARTAIGLEPEEAPKGKDAKKAGAAK